MPTNSLNTLFFLLKFLLDWCCRHYLFSFCEDCASLRLSVWIQWVAPQRVTLQPYRGGKLNKRYRKKQRNIEFCFEPSVHYRNEEPVTRIALLATGGFVAQLVMVLSKQLEGTNSLEDWTFQRLLLCNCLNLSWTCVDHFYTWMSVIPLIEKRFSCCDASIDKAKQKRKE